MADLEFRFYASDVDIQKHFILNVSFEINGQLYGVGDIEIFYKVAFKTFIVIKS